MTSDQTIIDQITEALKSSLPEWLGPGTRLQSEQPGRMDRPYTVILDYNAADPDGQEVSLILKLPREKWMHTLREIIGSEEIRSVAVQRAEILREVEKAVGASDNQNLVAVHIFGVLLDYCAISMERLTFTTFKRLFFHRPVLLRGKRFFQSVDQAVYIAGQWAKLFHDTFKQPEEYSTGQLDVISSVNDMIGSIEELTGKDLQTLRGEFTEKHESIKNTRHPVSSLHNDLTFNNLFITDEGKIGGFDPTPEPPGSIYQDLARILTDCTTRNHQIITQGLYFGRHFPQLVESSFLRGYASDIDKDTLNFFCASLVLEKWVGFEAEDLYRKSIVTSFPGARSVFRPLIDRYFHKLIQYYLSR